MTKQKLVKIISKNAEVDDLKTQLEQERGALHQAEAQLAEMQAGVNSFRMHCRLKLGTWVDEIIELYIEKQRLLTHLQLKSQADAEGIDFNSEDWLKEPAPFSVEEEEGFIDDLSDTLDIPYDISSNGEKGLRKLYRNLARRFHPDFSEGAIQKQYATSMMAAVNQAYENRDLATLHDLAGNPDPKLAEEIRAVSGKHKSQIQKLKRQLSKCRQMRRRATLRYNMLQNENITKLWQRAQLIDQPEGENWWDEVATSLQDQVKRYQDEISEIMARSI